MGKNKVVVIGTYISDMFTKSEDISKYVRIIASDRTHFFTRMLITFGDYLTKHSKMFERVRYIAAGEPSGTFPNGTITGIMDMVNRSEIDISTDSHIMNEVLTDIMDFVYPFELGSHSFITRKAEYKPQTFGILQAFSLPLWIAIISTLIAMSLVYYTAFKGRYSFDKILLHIFAVLMRQSSILKPSSMIKQLLGFSWVVGAMFLCLAYDSVILAFLSFPPIIQVKNVPQLARAVKEGHYQCVANPNTAIPRALSESEDENLKIIGRDTLTNDLYFENWYDFYYDNGKPNVALISATFDLEVFSTEQNFVSQDLFLEVMNSMPIRKDFCCKQLADSFVHRMMASGLYFQYKNDKNFLFHFPRLMEHVGKDTSKRALTLTDVASAFIFLIFGHIISFLVLIVEVLSHRVKIKKKSRVIIAYKKDLVLLAYPVDQKDVAKP